MIKYSILIPSRERMRSCHRLLESVLVTPKDIDMIECLLTIDEDEPAEEMYRSLVWHYAARMDIKLLVRKRTDNISKDYYNWMAEQSTGDVLWVLNDDCEIITEQWDVLAEEMIIKAMDGYKGNSLIWYGDVNDTTRNYNNNGQYSCFPMMSKEAFAVLGYFFDPRIPTWGADKFIKMLFERNNRVIDMSEIQVIHHMMEGYEKNDEAHSHMKRVCESQHGAETRINYEPEIEKLRRAIDAQ